MKIKNLATLALTFTFALPTISRAALTENILLTRDQVRNAQWEFTKTSSEGDFKMSKNLTYSEGSYYLVYEPSSSAPATAQKREYTKKFAKYDTDVPGHDGVKGYANLHIEKGAEHEVNVTFNLDLVSQVGTEFLYNNAHEPVHFEIVKGDWDAYKTQGTELVLKASTKGEQSYLQARREIVTPLIQKGNDLTRLVFFSNKVSQLGGFVLGKLFGNGAVDGVLPVAFTDGKINTLAFLDEPQGDVKERGIFMTLEGDKMKIQVSSVKTMVKASLLVKPKKKYADFYFNRWTKTIEENYRKIEVINKDLINDQN